MFDTVSFICCFWPHRKSFFSRRRRFFIFVRARILSIKDFTWEISCKLYELKMHFYRFKIKYISSFTKERNIFSLLLVSLVLSRKRRITPLGKNLPFTLWKLSFFIADSWIILLVECHWTLCLYFWESFGLRKCPKLLGNRFVDTRFYDFLSTLQCKHVYRIWN